MRNDGMPSRDAVEPLPGGYTLRQAKKQRRAESLQTEGHTKKQEDLSQLNLDVLFLIAQYIDPMDLLNLARTSKSLRELLMNKVSAFVWKAALRQFKGLPDCPTDMSEPEYTQLVFGNKCQACGRSAPTVLWRMRRRYCPNCKRRRLCKLSSCDEAVGDVLVREKLTVNCEESTWVEKAQMESLLDEYRRSADKSQFLNEKRIQMSAIVNHAYGCEAWQQKQKDNVTKIRVERKKEILGRLHQLDYSSEINHFEWWEIRDSYGAFFWSAKPLTDQEWDQTWPTLREIMDNFRFERLDQTVYRPRRRVLAGEYSTYVSQWTQHGPTSDLFPHPGDLCHFGPFESIIMAPQANINGKLFAKAFEQLPDLANEWKTGLEAELAGVVKIALDLSPGNITHTEAVQINPDKLQLACALFYVVGYAGAFAYPDVFFVAMCDRDSSSSETNAVERTGSIRKRFGISLLKEASYIISTCGLDPGLATMDDMDCLNVRLRCLSCRRQANSIMNWRAAMWHASGHKRIRSQWELVSDEHIDAIEAVERSAKRKELSKYTRCLLCRPHVGNALRGNDIIDHLLKCHKIERNQVKKGVHYTHVGIRDSPPTAEIVTGGEVTFRKSTLL